MFKCENCKSEFIKDIYLTDKYGNIVFCCPQCNSENYHNIEQENPIRFKGSYFRELVTNE